MARAVKVGQRTIAQSKECAGEEAGVRIDARSYGYLARAKAVASRPVARPVWLRSEADVNLEKLVLLLLAVGAVFGIAYGFSCLLDLVQRWAVTERVMSGLI